MEYKNYNEMRKKYLSLIGLDNYNECLQVLEKAKDILPPGEYKSYYNDIMHMKAHMYCMCGKYDESMDCIEFLVERELLCGTWLINRLPHKDSERYLRLKEKNDALMAKVKEKAKFKHFVHLPNGYTKEKKFPLIIALHGGGQNVEEFSCGWKPDVFLKHGFIVVYVESSQLSWHNGYNWNDQGIVRRDIRDSYDLILQNYSVDTERVIIGGFCGGAIAVLDLIMTKVLPAKGFIVLHPEEKPESFTRENVLHAVKRGVRGVLMEGELLLPIKDEAEMMNMFNEAGLIYEFYVCKGEGLSIPDNMSCKLERALEFLTQ